MQKSKRKAKKKANRKSYNKVMVSHSESPEVNTARRICKFESCKTRLSMYNLNEYCGAHRVAGIDENWNRMEEIRFKKYQAQLKQIKKHKREKAAL